jgi:Mg-chelatase subunit ChlD
MQRILLSLCVALSVASGCGSEDNPGGHSTSSNASEDDEGGGGTTTSSKKDAGAGANKKDAGKGSGNASGGGGPGETCDSKTITADATPPDMLIVLDKSLSMALTRWTPSTAAVKDLTNKYQNVVSFGLEIFPAGFMCEAGMLDVPVAINNADKIATAIDSAIPIGITPTAQSLRNALKFVGDRHQVGDATATPAYVVLVTDGEPNCQDDATPDPINNSIEACQALADANVPVYVIGYEIDAVGEGTMNAMAKAGGTDKYFPVENQADLEAAFDMITKDVVRCEFELSEEPQDPSYVRVTIDGKTVALDSADGWTIDGRKITLTGGSCGTLKDGAAHLLGAKVECAPVMVQ